MNQGRALRFLTPGFTFAAVVLLGARALGRPPELWGTELAVLSLAGLATLVAAAVIFGHLASLVSRWWLDRRGKPEHFLPHPYVEAHWEALRENFFEVTGWPLKRRWVGWQLIFQSDPAALRTWAEARWGVYWADRNSITALALADVALMVFLTFGGRQTSGLGVTAVVAAAILAVEILWWRLLLWRSEQARKDVLAVEWLYFEAQRKREEFLALAAEGAEDETPEQRKAGVSGWMQKIGGVVSTFAGGNLPYNLSYGALMAILDRFERRKH